MERLLPEQVTSEAQREVLRLLCRAHELEVEKSELQADNLHRKNLLGQKEFLIQWYLQHRLLCEPLVHGQRQLLRGEAAPAFVRDSPQRQSTVVLQPHAVQCLH
jgi:kinesin family protein 18/19